MILDGVEKIAFGVETQDEQVGKDIGTPMRWATGWPLELALPEAQPALVGLGSLRPGDRQAAKCGEWEGALGVNLESPTWNGPRSGVRVPQ